MGPAQPVQLIDDNSVCLSLFDIKKHLLQGRAVGIAAGIASVGINFEQVPSFGLAIGTNSDSLFFNAVIFQLVFR